MSLRQFAAGVMTLAAVVAAAAGCSSTAANTTTTSAPATASQLFQQAVTNGKASPGVTVSVLLGSPQRASAKITTTAGPTTGVEHQSITIGTETSNATVELVGGTAYVKADAPGISALPLGITSPTITKRYAGQWIAVPASDSNFAELTSALTLGSVFSVVDLENLSRDQGGPSTVDGQKVVDLEGVSGSSSSANAGTAPPKCQVSVSASSRPLPVQIVCSQTGGASETITFGKWRAPPALSAPSPSVPIAVVLAAQTAVAG